MTVGHAGTKALTGRGSPTKPSHLAAGTGLVDEHRHRVEIKLTVEPGLPLLQDVGTIPPRGMRGLFGL